MGGEGVQGVESEGGRKEEAEERGREWYKAHCRGLHHQWWPQISPVPAVSASLHHTPTQGACSISMHY